jgi:hypothetical protein
MPDIGLLKMDVRVLDLPALRERLAAMESMLPMWKPIETCDVTSSPGEERQWILVYGDCGRALGYVIDYGDGARHVAAAGFNGVWKITHWMPLPAPPDDEA